MNNEDAIIYYNYIKDSELLTPQLREMLLDLPSGLHLGYVGMNPYTKMSAILNKMKKADLLTLMNGGIVRVNNDTGLLVYNLSDYKNIVEYVISGIDKQYLHNDRLRNNFLPNGTIHVPNIESIVDNTDISEMNIIEETLYLNSNTLEKFNMLLSKVLIDIDKYKIYPNHVVNSKDNLFVAEDNYSCRPLTGGEWKRHMRQVTYITNLNKEAK